MSEAATPTLRIDLASPVPPYEQIRSGLAGLIATGVLAAGDQLPPVRQLAADLGIAGGTVARAYRELETSGLVEGHGRRGTLVRTRAADERARLDALGRAAEQLTRTARELGFGEDAILAATRSALGRT